MSKDLRRRLVRPGDLDEISRGRLAISLRQVWQSFQSISPRHEAATDGVIRVL